MSSGKLVIARHGESEWNNLGKWTGLTDIGLTEKGKSDAKKIGESLRDIHFDAIYTSNLVRTEETLASILSTQGQVGESYIKAPELNERDYGDYTGKNKWEVKDEVGEEMFNRIRRDYDQPVPGGETLKMVYERSVPFYKENIVPKLLNGENVLIVAHGNSIRALIKYIENISDDGISEVEMLFDTALVYTVDEDGREETKEVRKVDIELSKKA